MSEEKYKIDSVRVQGVSMYQTDLVDLDGKPAGEARYCSVSLSWTANIGFGELTIEDRGDAGVSVFADGLPKAFVKAVVSKWVEDAEIKGVEIERRKKRKDKKRRE